MVYYCSRAKHQPDWDPWRRSLHPPHRCLHHLHQVILMRTMTRIFMITIINNIIIMTLGDENVGLGQ